MCIQYREHWNGDKMGVEYYIYRKTPIIENCLIHICDFENISLFVYELCFRVFIYKVDL